MTIYHNNIFQAVDVMQEVNQNEYRVGCTHCILYESSGISLDWAHGKVINSNYPELFTC